MLARTERIVHGTTVATNALLEHKGAKVGLLTTEGHRDIIEMREGLKDDRYNLRQPPPTQLVPRERRLGVRERIRPDGRVEIALDRGSLDAAIAVLRSQGVEAVAICYLHSWRDATHERATAEAVRAAMPGVYIALSAEVLPQIKEYDRVCTTVVNAYVGPALERYLTRLETRLREAGLRAPVLIIQSHGGVATIAEAVRLAAGGVLSGPAGGVAGSQYAARLLGHGDLIPFDMGGTSTDISLVVGGEAAIASDRRIAGQRVALQSLDIASIGAGGGSIARVDHSGVLHVGPESAGAQPGPACYGRGGVEATVTDANLVLGFLDPDNFLGGRVAARSPRRRGGRRSHRRQARCRSHGRCRGHLSRHQHAHGRRHPARLRAPRRRSATLRHPLVRRRGRAARDGCCTPARSQAGDRSPALGRAVGVGHARLQPALRGGANAHRRCQPSRCPERYARPSARWKPRDASGSRPRRSRAPSACGRPPTCATASRCSR